MKVIKKVKPMFNRLITTMDIYETDQYKNGMLDITKQKGSVKEYQTVVAVGTTVRDIKVGDEVLIDPTRYMTVKHNDKSLKKNVVGDELKVGYDIPTIKLDGKDHLLLFDQDISYIIEDSEEVEDPAEPLIIKPEKPSIIL